MRKIQGLSWLFVILLSGVALAQEAPEGPKCAGPESRQFDFWIGEWEVRAGDKLAGHNSIRPILDGCVLQETWSGAGGGAGSSFNFYDPQRGQWRQLWVWRNGTTLELEGQFADGKMVLEGVSKDRAGKPVHNRITWSRNGDGSVRQHWQTRAAKDDPWTTAFDGHYLQRGPDEAAPSPDREPAG